MSVSALENNLHEKFSELNEKEIASFQAVLSEMAAKQNWSKVANKLIDIS